MPTFDSNRVTIAYDALGDGPEIVLVHGFASSRIRNWKDTRWYETLASARRRVIALDCGEHGQRKKPQDPAAYGAELMTGDVIRLMDHLGVARADLMGYSMGGRIAATLLARHGQRFAAAQLGGLRARLPRERRDAEAIARVLDAEDPATITHPVGKTFRVFAEQGKNDLRALAACMRGLRHTVDATELAQIRAPVLVIVGERDTLV